MAQVDLWSRYWIRIGMWHITPCDTLFIRKSINAQMLGTLDFMGPTCYLILALVPFLPAKKYLFSSELFWLSCAFSCILTVFQQSQSQQGYLWMHSTRFISAIFIELTCWLIKSLQNLCVCVNLSAIRQKYFGYEILSPLADKKEDVSLFLL